MDMFIHFFHNRPRNRKVCMVIFSTYYPVKQNCVYMDDNTVITICFCSRYHTPSYTTTIVMRTIFWKMYYSRMRWIPKHVKFCEQHFQHFMHIIHIKLAVRREDMVPFWVTSSKIFHTRTYLKSTAIYTQIKYIICV